MKAMLFLALLAPNQDYAPADPVSPLPIGSTRAEAGESKSLFRRSFGEDIGLLLGTDTRAYLRIFEWEDEGRFLACLSRDGVGFAHELYLGHRITLWIEARTALFWGTGRVGLIWYPGEGGRLPLGLDLVNRRILTPSREEVVETTFRVVSLYLAFGRTVKR
jgi:hypothetical protein